MSGRALESMTPIRSKIAIPGEAAAVQNGNLAEQMEAIARAGASIVQGPSITQFGDPSNSTLFFFPVGPLLQ